MILYKIMGAGGTGSRAEAPVAVETPNGNPDLRHGYVIPEQLWAPYLLQHDLLPVWEHLLERRGSRVMIEGGKVTRLLFGWHWINDDGDPTPLGDIDVFHVRGVDKSDPSQELPAGVTVSKSNPSIGRGVLATEGGNELDIIRVHELKAEYSASIERIKGYLATITSQRLRENLGDDPKLGKLVNMLRILESIEMNDPIKLIGSFSLYANQTLMLELIRNKFGGFTLSVVDPLDVLGNETVNLKEQLQQLEAEWRNSPIHIPLIDNDSADHTNIYQLYLDLLEYIGEKKDGHYGIQLGIADPIFKRAINGINVMVKTGVDNNISYRFDENYYEQYRRILQLITQDPEVISEDARAWFDRKTIETFGRASSTDPIMAYQFFFERFKNISPIVGANNTEIINSDDGSLNRFGARVRDVMARYFGYTISEIPRGEIRNPYRVVDLENRPTSINEIIAVLAYVFSQTYPGNDPSRFISEVCSRWPEQSKEKVSISHQNPSGFSHNANVEEAMAFLSRISENVDIQSVASSWPKSITYTETEND